MSPIDYREAARQAYANINKKGVTYVMFEGKVPSDLTRAVFPALVKQMILDAKYDNILIVYDTYALLAMEDYMRLFDGSVDEEDMPKGNNNSKIVYTTHHEDGSTHKTTLSFADGNHRSSMRSVSANIVVAPECETLKTESLFDALSFLCQNGKVILGTSAPKGKSKHKFLNDEEEHQGIQRITI